MNDIDIEIILPLPVTLNKLTHNNRSKNGGKGGRSKSQRAKQWYRQAQHAVLPYVRANVAECNKNILERQKCHDWGKKQICLQTLHERHLDLSYTVVYKYYFNSRREVLPRDIFNYEKQLSDFLVDMGLLLEDSFIDDGRVRRMPRDENERVEIKIIKKFDFYED